jgi:hypothetical protein
VRRPTSEMLLIESGRKSMGSSQPAAARTSRGGRRVASVATQPSALTCQSPLASAYPSSCHSSFIVYRQCA